MKKKTTEHKKLVLGRETVKTMHEIREGRLQNVQGGRMCTNTGCSEPESGCGIVTAYGP